MRVLGPNCLGVIDTFTPINATFAAGTPPKGNMAFMSQSGALCTSMLDIALAERVGFSFFVSLGNKADLGEIDFLQAWAEPANVKVVLAYLEGINDGARFMSVAREFTKQKPIVAIKAGVTAGGSRAVSSHTGSLAGSERAYEAAFKQTGIIRADSIEQLFDFGVAMARQPLPKNESVAIVTNAGGPGIMATDAIERAGFSLASLDKSTIEKLRAALPPAASTLNPVDLLGDANMELYKAAIELLLDRPQRGRPGRHPHPAVLDAYRRGGRGSRGGREAQEDTRARLFHGGGVDRAGGEYAHRQRRPELYRAGAGHRRPLRHGKAARLAGGAPAAFERFEADREAVAKVFEKVRSERRLTIGDAEARSILEAYAYPRAEIETMRDGR